MSSSKTRIQNYLRQNKISELFEEMMGKLIKDLPASPIHYLANLLQNKEKKIKHIVRDDSTTTKENKVEISSNAMLWATAPAQMKPTSPRDKTSQQSTSPEVRKYDKPWQTHSKKSPAKSKSGSKLNQTTPVTKSTKNEKPEWNQKTKISSGDKIDDVIDGGDDQIDLGLVYAKPKVVGEHQVKVKTDEEDIESELSLSGKYKTEENKKSDNVSTSKKSAKMSAKEAKRKRLEELKKMVDESQSKSSKPKSISPVTINSDETDDGALEILEDADELIREGVKNPPKTGVVVGRSGRKSKDEIEFVLNMSKFFDELGGMEGLNQTNKGSDVQNKFDEDDDDFESASQVTGPRKPVWEAPESDVESVLSQIKSARRSDINVESFVSRSAAKKQVEPKPEKQKRKSSETSRPRTAPSRSHSNVEMNGEHSNGRETYRVMDPKSTKSPRSRPTTPKGSEIGMASRRLSQASNLSDAPKKTSEGVKNKDKKKKKKSDPADDVPDTKPKNH
uniref:uncharacterized protein C8orf34-like n=1 Tax=Styela clava TaxID=7725 RepID=UPI001939F20E|nr:uncharacterized protein C8orf34-like [Styela clava]